MAWDKKRKCVVCPRDRRCLPPPTARMSRYQEAWDPGGCCSKAASPPPHPRPQGAHPPTSSGLPPEVEFIPNP